MDEEGLGSPKCFESSMIFQLITVFTWRFDGSATWRYWVARSRAAGQLFNSWCATPRLRELVWFWPRTASFSNCLGRFGRLTLMCCVSFARRLSMFFKQLGDRSRFEDGMFHCFPELYMLQYHAVSCSMFRCWPSICENSILKHKQWYFLHDILEPEVSKYLEMRHRSGLRPDIVAFALYRHRAHCVSLVAMVNLPKVVNIGDDLGSSPDYPFVKARTQGMLAVSTGMTMSGSWGTLFSELKSYVYI